LVFAHAAQLDPETLAEASAAIAAQIRIADSEHEAVKAALAPGTLCVILVDSPTLDAASVCRRVRFAKLLTPILVLTPDPDGKQQALLAAGADQVLAIGDARRMTIQLQAMIRRVRGKNGILRCGDIRLDPERRRATVAGVWLDLSQYEFELLYLLGAHAGFAVSLEELGIELLGRAPSRLDRKALVQRMARLRQKLGPFGESLESRHGSYTLRVPGARERRRSDVEELRPPDALRTKGRAEREYREDELRYEVSG